MSQEKLSAYMVSEEFDVSKMTSAERLQIAGKLLGVKKEDVNQFGARTSRLANLAVRHRRALRKTLECCLEGIFALVWVGDADELGLRALLGLEKSSSGIGEKLVHSFRTSVALAYSLRKIDHQRQTSHFHQLLSISAANMTYDETKRLLKDAVSPSLLTRTKHTRKQSASSSATSAPALRMNVSGPLKAFPTPHAFKEARKHVREVGPGLPQRRVVHQRLNTMPEAVLEHLAQYLSENRRTLEASNQNADAGKVYALNKSPFKMYTEYLVRTSLTHLTGITIYLSCIGSLPSRQNAAYVSFKIQPTFSSRWILQGYGSVMCVLSVRPGRL